MQASVIIPAHNEADSIGACLESLLSTSPIHLDVIVVCNGCTDSTEAIAESFGKKITNISTEVASKANALNLGDSVARFFPRFYIDADVIITPESIRRMIEVMNSGGWCAASPGVEMNLDRCSWPVRAYYAVWTDLPYFKEGLMGSGVYALSEKGRKHFQQFPDIIADDRFIRALFTNQQRVCVPGAISRVYAPKDLNGLFKIKTRSRIGGYQFEQKYPELIANEEKKYAGSFTSKILKPNQTIKVLFYILFNLVTRLRARLALKTIKSYKWERDETSRQR